MKSRLWSLCVIKAGVTLDALDAVIQVNQLFASKFVDVSNLGGAFLWFLYPFLYVF